MSAKLATLLAWFLLTSLRLRSLVQEMRPGNAGGEAAPFRVVLISQELDNPFWRRVEQGARDTAAGYGLNMEYTGPLRISAAEQIRLLEKAIASKPDAIFVQGVSDPRSDVLINGAVDQGIPVITVDADAPHSRRLAYVGTDNEEAGRRLGELVVQAAGPAPAARVGVILGSADAENQLLRLQGLRSVLSRYPGVVIADTRSSNISRLEAARQAAEMWDRDPGIGVMVGLSALDAAGIRQAAGERKKNAVRIFGFDDVEATRQAIADGSVQAAVVQKPYEIGAGAVRLLQQYRQGEALPERLLTGTSILDAAGVKAGGGTP